MINFTSPITESHTYNNFSMKEKTPVAKINLRGDLENKDFVSKVGKILGIILPLFVFCLVKSINGDFNTFFWIFCFTNWLYVSALFIFVIFYIKRKLV